MAAGDLEDGLHVGGDAGVVDGDDGAGAFGDRFFDQALVDVEGVGADVDETDARPAQGEGVGGGDEGVGRHDDLVARLEVAEDGRHLERGGAGVGQQHLAGAEAFFHPGVALLRELAVACEVAAEDRLGDVVLLLADDERAVEGDLHRLPT